MPNALQLSKEHRVTASSIGAASATLATSNIVTFSLATVVVKGLEPSNELISEVVGASFTLVNLLLVVCSIHSSCIGSASSLNLLKQLKERLLYRHIVVLTIPTPSTLLTQGSDDNVTLVPFIRG